MNNACCLQHPALMVNMTIMLKRRDCLLVSWCGMQSILGKLRPVYLSAYSCNDQETFQGVQLVLDTYQMCPDLILYTHRHIKVAG